jgi:virginiamycin B lyase
VIALQFRRRTICTTVAMIAAVTNAGGASAQNGTAATEGQRPSPPVVRPMTDLKVAATIPVGKTADWVAITADAVWVGSSGPNSVNAIDPRTNRVTTIALPGRPCAGITADADFVWVPLCGPIPKLAKVDVRKRVLDRVFDVGPVRGEQSIAVGAGSVWLVTDKTGSLARIDPVSGAVLNVIQLPPGSYNPVFSDGFVWVTRVEGAEVTIVDARTSKIVGSIPVGKAPRFVTAGHGAVWTLNQGNGDVSRIDIATRRTTVTLPLNTPGPGGDIAFGAGRVWTTMMKTPLTVVDAATATALCQWTGDGGDSLSVGHKAVWLTNLRSGTVSRIPLKALPKDCRARR